MTNPNLQEHQPVRMTTLAVAAAIAATPAASQDTAVTMDAYNLIFLCSEKVRRSEDVSEYAEELVKRTNLSVNSDYQRLGIECLDRHFAYPHVFEDGEFMSQRAKNAVVNEEEKVKAERRAAYSSAVVRVCFAELKVDRFRALTTPICGEVFKAVGLSD